MNYRSTRLSCYAGYIVQAVIVNLAPLLFVVFQDEYGLSLAQISALILVNFLTQLLTDLVATHCADRVGYRILAALAHAAAALGLILFGLLPLVTAAPFAGLVVAVVLYAVGGGLIEVLVSPIIDALPSRDGHAGMALLHSFYSWGQLLTVLLSAFFLKFFGNGYWYVLPFVYALIPIANFFSFLRCPLPPPVTEETKTPLRVLLANPMFWCCVVVMICAGATEQVMAQWASLFAEDALGLSKFVGDLLGPCLFALFMGIGRTLYGVVGHKLSMRPFLIGSGILCVACFAVTALVPNAFVSLLGCAATGFAVSLLWPGMLAEAGVHFPRGGTALFAMLAIAGDLGCSIGPWLVGLVGDALSADPYFVELGLQFGMSPLQIGLRGGILIGTVFPIVLSIGLGAYSLLLRRKQPNPSGDESASQTHDPEQ